LVRLQKRMWRIAFFTGLGVYLEAILTLVFVSSGALSLAACVVIGALLSIQLTLIHRPARQLARGTLARKHRAFLVSAPAFVAITAFGSQEQMAAAIAAALVAAIGVWAAVGGLRVAREYGRPLGDMRDSTVLVDLLSFSPREALAAR